MFLIHSTDAGMLPWDLSSQRANWNHPIDRDRLGLQNDPQMVG